MNIKTKNNDLNINSVLYFEIDSNQYLIYKKGKETYISQLKYVEDKITLTTPDSNDALTLKNLIKELTSKEPDLKVFIDSKYKCLNPRSLNGKDIKEENSIKIVMEKDSYKNFIKNPYLTYEPKTTEDKKKEDKEEKENETKNNSPAKKLIIILLIFVAAYQIIVTYNYFKYGEIKFDFWNINKVKNSNENGTGNQNTPTVNPITDIPTNIPNENTLTPNEEVTTNPVENNKLNYNDALYCYKRMSKDEELYSESSGERIGIFFDENNKMLSTIEYSFFNSKENYYKSNGYCSNLEECNKLAKEKGCINDDGTETIKGCLYLTFEEKENNVIASYYIDINKNETLNKEFQEGCPNCSKEELKATINKSNENEDIDLKWTCE